MRSPCPATSTTNATLALLIDDEMRAAGITISPEARAALLPLLGGDRLASRSELQKLTLYARAQGNVELADVMAVIADASTLALDELIDAAFAGRTGELEAQFAKTQVAGTSPGINRIGRPAAGGGAPPGDGSPSTTARRPTQAIESMQPFVHFSRKAAVEGALRTWSSERLERAMGQLADALLETRKQPALADAIAQRTLLVVGGERATAVLSRRRSAQPPRTMRYPNLCLSSGSNSPSTKTYATTHGASERLLQA